MKILVVDDDVTVSNMVKDGLTADANTVEVTNDGADGSFLARSFDYDLIILDYSLPKKDGLQICKDIRNAGKLTPVIFLSVADSIGTKVAAFDAGADDYVTKPFSIEELRARIRALARRPKQIQSPNLKIGDLILDNDTQTVRRDGKIIKLTMKEYNLLEYLMRNVGKVQSRAMIMEHVWTAERDPFSNTIETHIRNLRKKINFKNKPDLIANIQGRGYILDTPENLRMMHRV